MLGCYIVQDAHSVYRMKAGSVRVLGRLNYGQGSVEGTAITDLFVPYTSTSSIRRET